MTQQSSLQEEKYQVGDLVHLRIPQTQSPIGMIVGGPFTEDSYYEVLFDERTIEVVNYSIMSFDMMEKMKTKGVFKDEILHLVNQEINTIHNNDIRSRSLNATSNIVFEFSEKFWSYAITLAAFPAKSKQKLILQQQIEDFVSGATCGKVHSVLFVDKDLSGTIDAWKS